MLCFSSCASAAARRAGQRDIAELGSIAQEGTSHDDTAQTPANPLPKFMGSVKKLMGGDKGSSQARGMGHNFANDFMSLRWEIGACQPFPRGEQL